MANLRRENHYLPVCYQRGFADDGGKVWVKDALKSEPEPRNPKNVGKSRSLYIRRVNGVEDDQIEKFFGDDVETGFGLLSQRIKNEGPKVDLSGTDLGFLVRFVAAQMFRTVGHKECVNVQAGRTVDRDTYLSVMGRQMHTVTKAWGENLPSFQLLTSLPFVNRYFITGDNPVVVLIPTKTTISVPVTTVQTITQLPDILNNPEAEFVMTLSPHMAVRIVQQQPSYIKVVNLDPIAVLKVNDLVRNQSQLFTLARDKESLPRRC
jgi:hypothetical protein